MQKCKSCNQPYTPRMSGGNGYCRSCAMLKNAKDSVCACGKEYKNINNKQFRCPECQTKHEREQKAEWARRNYAMKTGCYPAVKDTRPAWYRRILEGKYNFPRRGMNADKERFITADGEIVT